MEVCAVIANYLVDEGIWQRPEMDHDTYNITNSGMAVIMQFGWAKKMGNVVVCLI